MQKKLGLGIESKSERPTMGGGHPGGMSGGGKGGGSGGRGGGQRGGGQRPGGQPGSGMEQNNIDVWVKIQLAP